VTSFSVVILDSGDKDFVAAPVTSRPSVAEFDLVLQNWRDAGLNVPSTVGLHKIAVLSKANIRRSVGSLAPSDLASVHAKLCRAFCADHV
jgi:mRNA-degrading endonuclease toxin of MazEF toxin-antitoxin module